MSEKTSGMQSLLNGTELGAYTIIRLIGRGGMGEVYEAYEQRLQRRVAIKVIAPEKSEENGEGDVVRRFLQEARTLAQVNHPNIVTIFGIDKINDTQFIAMEFVDGALLKDIFSLFVLSADEATPMFIQMLEGLRALHENKILHRDLKPHNLMLRANGQIKIFDFGIAKREGDRDNEKTSAGIVVGTLAYLPPEVLFGFPASPRSDLWSLGAIFYECLTGQPLVSLHNIKIKGVRAAADSEVIFPAETLAWVPEEMRQIIARLCEKDPEKRYSSAGMVIEDLKRFQASRPLVPANVFNSLAKSVNNVATLKAKIDPKASRDPKIKRALALAQITGATSISSEPEAAPANEQYPVITGEMKDSVTGRRRARRVRSRKKKSKGLYTQGAVYAVVAVLLVALWFKIRPQANDEAATKTHVGPVVMQAPADHQDLWLDAIQSPVFTWSRVVDQGEYELQVNTDTPDARVLSTDPVQGKTFRSEHSLPEGKYQWRLVPMKGQGEADPAYHFTISYLTRVELNLPEAMQVIDVPADKKPGFYTADLRWKCKLGATKYRVQIFADGNRNMPANDSVVSDCAFKGFALLPGTYDWQVRVEEPQVARGNYSELRRLTLHGVAGGATPAVASSSESAAPAVDFTTRVPQLRSMHTESTLRFTGRKQTAGTPVLKWLPVKGAEAYQLQIFAKADATHPIVDERLNETQYEWRHALPGSGFWRVRAVDASGAISKFSSRGKIEVHLQAPVVQPAVKGEVSWNEIPEAAQYIVQSSAAPTFADVKSDVSAKPQFKLPVSAKPTFIRVAAADGDGHAVSEYSAVVTVAPQVVPLASGPNLLTPPQGAHPHVGKSGRISVLFSWDKVDAAVSYQLEIASDAQFTKIIDRQETKGRGFLMKEAQLHGPVFWRVRAVFPKGREPASNTSWSTTRNFEVR